MRTLLGLLVAAVLVACAGDAPAKPVVDAGADAYVAPTECDEDAGGACEDGIHTQYAYVKASPASVRKKSFGASIALSADGTTMVVGAVGEGSNAIGIDGNQADSSATESGAVYVFTRSGSVWSQQAYIKASNTEASDRFGNSVALSADGSILAVGASYEDSNATGIDGNQTNNSASYSGAVYVFTRSGSVWSQHAYIKASNSDAHDLFGSAVAQSTDGDTLAIGAYGEASHAGGIDGYQRDNSAPESGAVYVFR